MGWRWTWVYLTGGLMWVLLLGIGFWVGKHFPF